MHHEDNDNDNVIQVGVLSITLRAYNEMRRIAHIHMHMHNETGEAVFNTNTLLNSGRLQTTNTSEDVVEC